MREEVRVRFAPSPTGPLHIGGVRTALYNYLFARKLGGKFLLRIEDTDQTRYVEGAEQYIIDTLDWAGLDLDEGVGIGGKYGPYKQSERKHLYKQYADQLVANDLAYYAFDTPEELTNEREKAKKQGLPGWQYNGITRQYMKNSTSLSVDEVNERIQSGEPYVIRIKVPRNEEIKINDVIRGWVVFNSAQIDDKVIFKADGMPTYHLANVVDDYLMEISHVIRGEEWLPSTPIHVLLYKFLGWEDVMPQFAHLPLILKPDGNGKLSKRDGDRLGFPVFSLDWKNPETGEMSSGYKERGFFPEAFINMLAFLGWNPGTEQEVFPKEELINAFSLERIGKSGAKFDFDKAKWYNQQFLRKKSDKQLLELLKSSFEQAGIDKKEDYLLKYISLFKDRATFLPDLLEQGYYMFELPKTYNRKVLKKKWKEERIPVFEELLKDMENIDCWSSSEIEIVSKKIMEKHNLGFGDVLQVFRVMISGEAGGPPIFELAEMMGKEEVLDRVSNCISQFSSLKQEL